MGSAGRGVGSQTAARGVRSRMCFPLRSRTLRATLGWWRPKRRRVSMWVWRCPKVRTSLPRRPGWYSRMSWNYCRPPRLCGRNVSALFLWLERGVVRPNWGNCVNWRMYPARTPVRAFAQLVARVRVLQVKDSRRINELIETVKSRHPQNISK